MKAKCHSIKILAIMLAVLSPVTIVKSADLTDEQIENLVRRSYQYVAMYNVNNKFAMSQSGWNTVDDDEGIAIHIAVDKPEGVPEENWLPVKPGDYDMDVIMRLYVPDLEKFKDWTPPKAEKVGVK